MLTRTQHAPSAFEIDIITCQLGRAPRGLEAIAAVDGEGTPLALRMAPIVNGAPFPTLYWLCSERLKVEISHLEAAGVIKQLEHRLQEDPDFLAAYHQSHRDYIAERWEWMSAEQKADIERRGYTQVLSERGVGGIASWDQVRCLHTQYAHHLGRYNAIGQWLDDTYQLDRCLP
jgi:hypothetical protein